jgi:hypothetical protein
MVTGRDSNIQNPNKFSFSKTQGVAVTNCLFRKN